MNLLPYALAWAVLATIVIVLAIYRNILAGRGDEMVHVQDIEAGMVTQQQILAKKLDAIDRWGKILTAVVFVAGLALAGSYVYEVWEQSNRIVIR
jgi:hypothetical protein